MRNFQEVARDEASVTFEGGSGLPAVDEDAITFADVGPDGLIVRGNFSKLFVPANHRVEFKPDGGVLLAAWASGYNCTNCQLDTFFVLEGLEL